MRALVVAALFAVVLPWPAHADIARSADPAGDLDHGADLLRVVLTHDNRIRVDATHHNLRAHPKRGAGLTVFFDTDAADEGPEYIFGTGLMDGTDYLLSTAKGWKAGKAVDCKYHLDLDYDANLSHVWFARGCFGKPAAVRVAVKVAAEARLDTGEVVVDWHKDHRSFTRWVGQY